MSYTYKDTKLSNGNTLHYKITEDGTAYQKDTPEEIVKILENARKMHTRLRVYYGDTKTGRDWEEDYDVFGTIGRSTGSIKIPLMINNSRSTGGGGLLDNCIVKIEYASLTKGTRPLYQHPQYHRGDDPMETRTHYKKPVKKSTKNKSGRSDTSTVVGGIR